MGEEPGEHILTREEITSLTLWSVASENAMAGQAMASPATVVCTTRRRVTMPSNRKPRRKIRSVPTAMAIASGSSSGGR